MTPFHILVTIFLLCFVSSHTSLSFSGLHYICICMQVACNRSFFSSSKQRKWPQSDTHIVSQSLCIPVRLSSALWYHLEGIALKTLFRVWCSRQHSVPWLFALNSGFSLGWLLRSISALELQCTQARFCFAQQAQMNRAEGLGLLTAGIQVRFSGCLCFYSLGGGQFWVAPQYVIEEYVSKL